MKNIKQFFKLTVVLSIGIASTCFADTDTNNIKKTIDNTSRIMLLKEIKQEKSIGSYKNLLNNKNNCKLITAADEELHEKRSSYCGNMSPLQCCYMLCSWAQTPPGDEYDKCIWGCMDSFGAL